MGREERKADGENPTRFFFFFSISSHFIHKSSLENLVISRQAMRWMLVIVGFN